MKVKKVRVHDLDESIVASKYPMATDIDSLTDEITSTVEALGSSKSGSGHDQFLTGILVSFDLTCSNKMWVELERYHFIPFVSSQSTMHRITKFDISKSCNEYVLPSIIYEIQKLINIYNEIEDKSSEKAVDLYLRILYNIPSGFELTARMTTNYRQLKTIYHQRKTHRLPEWRSFCKWIEELPKFKELILNAKR